jgi:hypothetical protein
VHILFEPAEDGSSIEQNEDDIPVEYIEAFKDAPGARHPFTRYTMHQPLAQDHMAWETAGPIYDRTEERLAASDRGIVMFRDMLKREIEKVGKGMDPLGVFRDDHPMIDTKLTEALASGQYGDPAARKIWQIKDEDRRRIIGDPRRAEIRQDLA